MHAGTDWRDARGQERVDRFPDGHAGERAELEGIARRFEGGGLSIAPEVAVAMARSASGKLSTNLPFDASQRCWLHKTLNVLDKFRNRSAQCAQRPA